MRATIKKYRSSNHSAVSIGSNDDLLTEILLCLPLKPICRFKCVSNQWWSLLSDTSFTLRYDTRHFRHKSPPGLFGNTNNQYYPFDDEDRTDPPLCNLNFFSGPNLIRILQSCNGLLLCTSYFGGNYAHEYYVFNPTTGQHTMIPPVHGVIPVHKKISFMGLAFHQTDCPHYKVVCILKLDVGGEEKQSKRNLIGKEKLFQIRTYSSDTRQWKISVESFSAHDPIFGSGVYWNGAIYWSLIDHSYMYFKFDVEELHSLPLPVETISSKRVERYLGVSRGHLHLIVYESEYEYEINLLPLKVYEMSMDRSGWFLKYHVELDQLKQLAGSFVKWYLPSLTVIDVIRGTKYEDTFMVLRIRELFITYNVHDKSFKPISKLNNIYENRKNPCPPIPDTFHRYSQTLASL